MGESRERAVLSELFQEMKIGLWTSSCSSVPSLIVKLLLKHGADASKKNRDGHTPLDLVKEGDQDVVDLLRGDSALLDAAKKGNTGR